MKKLSKLVILSLVLVIFMGLTVGLALFVQQKLHPAPAPVAITKDGIIKEIQAMSRLNTVAFSVDTVITAQKEGNWYKLWQDGQKGLFVANGRVLAGVDLSQLTADNVRISTTTTDNKPTTHIEIALPSAQIFEVYLDNIQVYDWQTGLFGMMSGDPAMLGDVQKAGKSEVLNKACQGDIMTIATNNAKEQLTGLFALSGASVSITSNTPAECRLP